MLLRGDRVLAVRRGPAVARPGCRQPVSGRVEPGGTQREAVAREVHEEVGLTVVPSVKVWESRTDDGVFRPHRWTARAETGYVVPDPREVAEARWVTPREFLARDPVFGGDRPFSARIPPAP